MEEKDITFNLFITDEKNKTINVTSDIDDNLDYLSIDEKVCIIGELINQICKQIIYDVYDDDDVEEYNEEDASQEEVRENLYEFNRELIYIVINTINNICRSKFDMKPELLEYGLVTFSNPLNSKDNGDLQIKETYYSNEIRTTDPLYASFDLITDSIVNMLQNRII